MNYSRIHSIVTLILFAFTSLNLYGQSVKQRLDLNGIYNTEIQRLLIPPIDQPTIIASFLVHPEIDPDYSICLIDSSGQYYLEMRMLDKNIWSELLSRFMQKQSLILPIKSNVRSIKISKKLKNEMVRAIKHVKPTKSDENMPVFYDGPVYEFWSIENEEPQTIKISWNLKSETYEYKLINQLALLTSEIKKNQFNESNFIKRLHLDNNQESKNNQDK